jgi:integrase
LNLILPLGLDFFVLLHLVTSFYPFGRENLRPFEPIFWSWLFLKTIAAMNDSGSATIHTIPSSHAADNRYDLIFPSENGRWQSRRNWQRRGFNTACEEAGLVETVTVDGEEVEQAKYRPYDLRHFFASMLIEKKTNLKKIQALMGHTNIETTLNVYGHLLEDSDRDKIGSIGLLSGMLEKSCGESVAGQA